MGRPEGSLIDLHPRVAEQVRDIKLRELATKGKTICDFCGNTYNRSQVLEVWEGNRLLQVTCKMCIRKSPLVIVWKPDGFYFELDKNTEHRGELVGLLDPSIRPMPK